ncbi:MAG: hypothetical protein IJC46_02025 [Clostridia bacterium]|nr:hypothetical protein [Clostridia bacterium]
MPLHDVRRYFGDEGDPCRLRAELLLKDISTVKNDPARLWRWAEIAAEETASF